MSINQEYLKRQANIQSLSFLNEQLNELSNQFDNSQDREELDKAILLISSILNRN